MCSTRPYYDRRTVQSKLDCPTLISGLKLIKRNNPNTYYAESVIHNKTIYLSSMITENFDDDIKIQCEETFQAINLALNKAGTDKARLLSLPCWNSGLHISKIL